MSSNLVNFHFDLLPYSIDDTAVTKFAQLAELITKWNKTFNLLGFNSVDELVSKHFLDSLMVLPYLEGTHIADVGTGAGFPGLPLAIAKPQWQFTLVDSNSKKTRFVQQAVIELGLQNVQVHHGRVESITSQNTNAGQPIEKFNTVVSRAFSDLSLFVQNSGNICKEKGLLLAMKGRYPKQEIEQFNTTFMLDDTAHFKIEAVHEVDVPKLDAERHVVLIRKC